MGSLRSFLGCFSYEGLRNAVPQKGELKVKFDGKDIALKHGVHFFYDV